MGIALSKGRNKKANSKKYSNDAEALNTQKKVTS